MISSLSNPRIKHLVRLRKRRDRDAEGVTLIEGVAEYLRAVNAGVSVRTLYYCPAIIDGTQLPGGDEVIEVGATALAKAAMRDSTEGIIAVVETPDTSLESVALSANPLVLVVEAVEKPGNLGALLRTADAVGVDAVVVADPATDVWNPNVVRASLGAVFTVRIGTGSTPEVVNWLATHNVTLCATTPTTESTHFDADLTGAIAIAVGAEHEGLSEALLEASKVPIRIPMTGTVDSLNTSVSAAVVLYEAVRQRRKAT